AGSISACAYLAFRGMGARCLLQGAPAWAVGVVLGYLPVLSMLALVPDFASAFWESVRFQFEIKSTNIPFPMPWPWKVAFRQLAPLDALHGVLLGVYLVAILALGALGLVWLLWNARRPVAPLLAASVCMALPYAHFAFSRADVSHIAQGIFPLAIGSLSLIR